MRNSRPELRTIARAIRQRFHFLSIINANLRGTFCQKLDEIAVTLDQVAADIVFFTETWLNSLIATDLIHVSNYTVYRKDRMENRSGGGVVIYVKSTIPVTPLGTFNSSHLETFWLLLRFTCMPRSVSHTLLGVIYHPPAASNALLYEHVSQVFYPMKQLQNN